MAVRKRPGGKARPAAAPAPARERAARPAVNPLDRYRPIKRMRDGRYFCDACMHPFEPAGQDVPSACGNCGSRAADVVASLRSEGVSDG